MAELTLVGGLTTAGELQNKCLIRNSSRPARKQGDMVEVMEVPSSEGIRMLGFLI